MKQHDLHQSLSEEYPEDKFVTEIDFRERKFLVTSKLKTGWKHEIEYLKFSESSDKELFDAVRGSYDAAS